MIWEERVPMLSINPDAATRDDVARLASELMEARNVLYQQSRLMKELRGDLAECADLLERYFKIR